MHWLVRSLLALALLCAPGIAAACDGPVTVCPGDGEGSIGLIVAGRVLPVVVAADADPAVRDAAARFAEDLGRVGGTAAPLVGEVPSGAPQAIIVGVAGMGGLVDRLAAAGKIDLAAVSGRWEAFGQFVVDDPLPGLERALVIAGSDRRGAAYGLYDLSEKIGVSPWHWWADVPVERRDTLFLTAGAHTDAPAVKYRGFFINDEDPAFGGWSRETFGGVNSRVYEHVFELLLRLKGNYLWPAMWGKSIAEDDPASLALAARMGVVLGTSHHEPLTRAHVEWERALAAKRAAGDWNYASNAEGLRRFWREGIERADAVPGLDYVATVGMRGDGDEAMSEETAIPLLERIVADQRGIIAEVTGRPAAQTPQVWALYKEVQDYYDQGMRVPDDVTLLFSDDNWGQIRRLPDPAAPPRAGGYGVYYHFDYVGGPRSYRWQDTNQVGKVWQQMDLAWQRGARTLWIVNVGDIKPMEYPLDFFMDMSWDPEAMTPEALAAHPREWAAATFGAAHGEAIGELLRDYGTLASRRKPELLDAKSFPPQEYRALVAAWDELVSRAARVRAALRPDQQDAYFQLVEHRVLALTNLYRMYAAAAFNAHYAGRDAVRAEASAAEVELTFARDAALRERWDQMAGGKWAGMMDQTHIGYTSWDNPPVDVMPAVLRGPALLSASPSPEPKAEAVLAIAAADFASAEGGGKFTWTRVPGLGNWGAAPLALPQGLPPTTAADGVYLEYRFRVPETGDYSLALLLAPTLDTIGSDGLRIGVSLDGGPVRELVLDLEPTNGAADTPPRAAWVRAVSENEARLETRFDAMPAGEHRLRVYRIDDNVIPQALLVSRADADQSSRVTQP
jgi:hypothetical protein